MTITALPSAPSRTDDPATFSSKADAWVLALADWTTQVNALSTDLAGLSLATPTILANANFKGTWLVGTAYTVPSSVYYSNRFWLALQSSTGQTPADNSAYWAPQDFYHSLAIVAVSADTIDCRLGNYFTKTISGNWNPAFSNPPSSRAYSFTLEVVNTSGTITWPTEVKWPEGATSPSLTTGKTHLFTFVTDDGGTRWRGASLGNYTT